MTETTTKPRKRMPTTPTELVKEAVKKTPSSHLNDPTVIPTTNLRVQIEHILSGYDNDFDLLAIEIKARVDRQADIARAREGCLALLGVLSRDDSPKPATEPDSDRLLHQP